MDFKIIAITPLKECSEKFRKVLKEDHDYYLYNNYEIQPQRIIEYESSIPVDLYNSPGGPSVTLSAIVGKNGSGKSSIIELFYACIFNAAYKSKVIPEKDEDGKVIKFEPGVKAMIYFKQGNKFYCLRCDGNDVAYRVQTGVSARFGRYSKVSPASTIDISRLFYTIVINYSHYSLNAKQHQWLRYLFHKNDGYQTPLVINPYRADGVININNEQDLTNARIVSSLLTLNSDGTRLYNELAPGKKATALKFKLNNEKLRYRKDQQLIKGIITDNQKDILDAIFKQFPIKNKPVQYETSDKNLKAAYTYLCKKLDAITGKYAPFMHKNYRFIHLVFYRDIKGTTSKYEFSLPRLRALLKKMAAKPSHITFKVRQAINFIDNIEFYNKTIGKFQPIELYARHVNSFRNNVKGGKPELMEFIPPSFFSVDIKFEDKGTLQNLSSGEKQTIYSSASWMYHLINLRSVREEKAVRYKSYNCINIVFDEIELYYHPEMQRDFINSFLLSLNRLQFDNKWSFNCIFITHSPFILSDIPNENILFLTDEGVPDEAAKGMLTFGANIHELLKSNFLLEHGTMGVFAQNKIRSLMEYLNGKNDKWKGQEADDFINLISEPLIRQSLRLLYTKKFPAPAAQLRSELSRIQAELDKITGQ